MKIIFKHSVRQLPVLALLALQSAYAVNPPHLPEEAKSIVEAQFLETYKTSLQLAQSLNAFSEIQRIPKENLEFIAPNEYTQELLAPYLNKAPKGAYVGVGADRAFMAVSMMPEITTAYLTDYSEGIVLFNRINLALIAIAADREDYVKLRLQAFLNGPISHWEKRLTESKNTQLWMWYLLKNPAIQRFWKHNVAYNTTQDMQRFHSPQNEEYRYLLRTKVVTVQTYQHDLVRFAHYMYDDQYFYPLQRLARSGRIQPIQLDFNHSHQRTAFFDGIRASGDLVSVLDLSNAWWSVYIKYENFLDTLEKFKVTSSVNSILILTENNHILMDSKHPKFQKRISGYEDLLSKSNIAVLLRNFFLQFAYKIFEINSLLDQKNWAKFLDSLVSKIAIEHDERLFETLEDTVQLNLHLDNSLPVKNVTEIDLNN